MQLEKWTVLRFAVLGAITFVRVLRMKELGCRTTGNDLLKVVPFRDHPSLTASMQDAYKNGSMAMGWIKAMFYGGLIWIQSEGVGITIYFSVSAICDNYTIFFINSNDFCQYVTAVALYSMATITFLPNCVVAYMLQDKWYDHGTWCSPKEGMQTKGKSKFIVIMVFVTVVSFWVRLKLVFDCGWTDFVRSFQESVHASYGNSMQVLIAVAVPPIVDLIQATSLIATGLKKAEDKAGGSLKEPLKSGPHMLKNQP